MKSLSRRDLLAAGGLTLLPARLRAQPPSNKLNLAFIGIGTYGARCLRELAPTQNVLAICDVDWRKRSEMNTNSVVASEVVQQYGQARRFDDWRQMLEDLDREIDGVVIAGADHMHAIASISAIKRGKPVYCEKPLAHSVSEVRAMAAAERKYPVATQTGVQGHASEDCRRIVEWIRDGAIGSVKEVHLFQTARPPDYFPSVADQQQALQRIHERIPVPPEVKWDLWLGPAPERPYHPMYLPRKWRAWLDFGTGILGDHGPHYLDPVVWALELGLPETIEADTNPEWDPGNDRQTFPHRAVVRYTFAANEKRPALALTWHCFDEPPVPEGWSGPLPGGGGIISGSEGTIVFGLMYQGRPGTTVPKLVTLLPEKLDQTYRRPAASLPRPASHWLEWVDAAKHGGRGSADFAYGGLLTEICLLGDIAIRHKGKLLHFDASSRQFLNADSANRMFASSYRPGWSLPT